jgi:hypothetical protein
MIRKFPEEMRDQKNYLELIKFFTSILIKVPFSLAIKKILTYFLLAHIYGTRFPIERLMMTVGDVAKTYKS